MFEGVLLAACMAAASLPTPSGPVGSARADSRSLWEVGLTPSLGGVLTLEEHETLQLAARTAALELALRKRDGGMLAIEGRWAGRRVADQELHRLRFSFGFGYAKRTRAFEVMALAAFVVEPWAILRDGRGHRPPNGTGGPVGPLVGGRVHLSAGVFFRPHAAVAFRLGPYLEATGTTFTGIANGRPIGANDIEDELLARLGGLEVGGGLG